MDKDADLSKLPLTRILGYLKPGQVVTLLGLIVALAAGAFTFGYWSQQRVSEVRATEIALSLTRAQDDLKRAQAKVASLEEADEKKKEDISFLQMKDQIVGLLALYYDQDARHWRHSMSQCLEARRDDAADSRSARYADEAEEKMRALGNSLMKVIRRHVDQSRSGEAGPGLRARLGKGIEPTLLFERDGSVWPLPGSFFAAEH